jgi:hypothetical protein
MADHLVVRGGEQRLRHEALTRSIIPKLAPDNCTLAASTGGEFTFTRL